MRHDIFEFSMDEMTGWDKFWRVILLSAVIAILVADLFYWRPG